MNNEARPILGLKELSRPKGAGYLYLSFSDKADSSPLVYFDLYYYAENFS